ncbi:MAG TPA: restriction endonuclease subunit S [Thermoanaerobaculia bacterium]|jgi:type I restriction enzyme S subunit|nr:restriction endonuclease subunit S [Thermoanaerobaculia bacterium]
MLTPKLRFIEFRNGPAWKEESFANLYELKPTNTLSRDKLNYDRGTVRNIHYGDIHTRFQTLFDVSQELVPFVTGGSTVDFDKNAFSAEGDLVFADASEDLTDVGKSIEVVALHGERVLSGTHTILATPRDSQLIVGFGGYLFRSGRMRAQIKNEAQGSKVYGISSGRLCKVNVCFPADPAEQQKIVGCLTSLDELIAAHRRKLDALRAHKKGLMQQLFPGEGESLPRVRFPEFRDAPKWDQEKLGDFVDISSGDSPSRFVLSSSGKYPFVKVEDLNNCVKYQVTGREFCNNSKAVVPRHSLLFPKRGAAIELNKLRVTAAEIVIDTNLMAITPKNGLMSEFLYYYTSNIGLSHIADTSTIPQINNKHIIPLGVFLPSTSEQERIAGCLLTLDEQISAEAKTFATLKTHKNGVMQQLFPSPEL